MMRDYPLTFELMDEMQDMYSELKYLRRENARLRQVEKEYDEFLRKSIQNSNQQIGNWIGLLLNYDIEVTER